jgi:hypothetical protein
LNRYKSAIAPLILTPKRKKEKKRKEKKRKQRICYTTLFPDENNLTSSPT